MAWRADRLTVTDNARLDGRGKPFLLTPCASLAEIRTVIVGHSHSATLAHALVRPLEPGDPPSDAIATARRVGLAGLSGTIRGNSSWISGVAAGLGRSKSIAIIWNGNQVYQEFLFSAGPPLDLMPDGFGADDVLPGATLVPVSAVRAQFEPTLADLDALLVQLGPSSGERWRIVLGTPPTIADDAVFEARIRQQPHFAERAGARGIDLATAPITPASVRHKLWFVLQSAMKDMAARRGAIFIPAPQAALDEEGYLKPELGGADATHAKVPYGRAVVEQIASLTDGGAHG